MEWGAPGVSPRRRSSAQSVRGQCGNVQRFQASQSFAKSSRSAPGSQRFPDCALVESRGQFEQHTPKKVSGEPDAHQPEEGLHADGQNKPITLSPLLWSRGRPVAGCAEHASVHRCHALPAEGLPAGDTLCRSFPLRMVQASGAADGADRGSAHGGGESAGSRAASAEGDWSADGTG